MPYDVVLLPTFAEAEAYRKRACAQNPQGLFATAISTFPAWVAGLWELYGDGRCLVDSMVREMAMRQELKRFAIQERGEGDWRTSPFATPGAAPLAARLVRTGSGIPAFEDALAAARVGSVEGLSERESALLGVVARYKDRLAALGLVELGDALALLAAQADVVFPHHLEVLIQDAAPLDVQRAHFVAACSNVTFDIRLAPGSEGVVAPPPDVALEAALPSGRYAAPALVCDLVREAPESAFALVCSDPERLYDRIAPVLAREGTACALRSLKMVGKTDFGKAFASLYRAVTDESNWRADLADFVRSPFSGFGARDAAEIDCALRADRAAVRDTVVAGLCARSDAFSRMEEIVRTPDADVLVGTVIDDVYAMAHRDAAYKREQVAAASAVRDITSAARLCGGTMEDCVAALERVAIDVSRVTDEGKAPRVVVANQRMASSLAPGSVDVLVLMDLASETYPVADKDDASDTVLSRLGIGRTDTSLARARRDFNALLRVAHGRIVVERPAFTADAEETYPCVVLEELVDAVLDSRPDLGELDEDARLPEALAKDARTRGEEDLYANAALAPARTQAPVEAVLPRAVWGELEPVAREKVLVTHRRLSDGTPLENPCPSPSELESYAECPYNWFVERRLNVQGLDEGFGPLEKGSFAHAALDEFYERLNAQGIAKVSAANIEVARDVMRATLADLAQAQADLDPGSGRLIPLSHLEAREMEEFERQLLAFVDYEEQLLPTFAPQKREFAFTPDAPAEYAGHNLVGRIDRIDVDENGRAVVLDYKGSVRPEHAIGDADEEHPGKIQTLIYAQAAARALGLDVVGALYVSYGKQHAVAGAYDPTVLEAPHLPALNKKSACEQDGPDSFAEVLNRTEDLVSHLLGQMEAGVIWTPETADACRYAPASSMPLAASPQHGKAE